MHCDQRDLVALLALYLLSQRRTKPTKLHVRPAKTQISLGIRPVWLESSLSAWRNLGSLATHWAHNEDSDLSLGGCPGWSVFAGRTCFCLFYRALAYMSTFFLFYIFPLFLFGTEEGCDLWLWHSLEIFEPPREKTNKMACAPSEDSDQPGHPPSLIRVFTVRSMDS